MVTGRSSAAEPTGAAPWAAPGPGCAWRGRARGLPGQVSREGGAGRCSWSGNVEEGGVGAQGPEELVSGAGNQGLLVEGHEPSQADCPGGDAAARCALELGLSLGERLLSERDWPNGHSCPSTERRARISN